MSVRLVLDNGTVDIFDAPDLPLAINKSIQDIEDLKGKRQSFSRTFAVPKSANNIEILKFTNVIEGVTDAGKQKRDCTLEVFGLPVVKGYCRVESVTDTEFKLKVFGDNMDWVNQLANLNLRDLTFSNETFDQSTIFSRNSATPSTNLVFYPLIDYGYINALGVNDFIDPFYLRPAFYLQPLIEQMFKEIGYGISSDFWDDSVIKRLFMPFSDGDAFVKELFTVGSYSESSFTLDNTTILRNLNGAGGANWIYTAGLTGLIPEADDLTKYPYTSYDNRDYSFDADYDYSGAGIANIDSGGVIVLDTDVGTIEMTEARITATCNVSMTSGTEAYLYIVQCDSSDTKKNQWSTSQTGITAPYTFNETLTADDVVVEDGDYFSLIIEFVSGTSDTSIGTLNSMNLSVVTKTAINVGWGEPYNPASMLPDITCAELLGHIQGLFDLAYTSDTFRRQVTIEPRFKWKEPDGTLNDGLFTGELDWSDKAVLKEIKYPTKYKRVQRFGYKKDDKDQGLKQFDLISTFGRDYELNDRFPEGIQSQESKFFAPTVTSPDYTINDNSAGAVRLAKIVSDEDPTSNNYKVTPRILLAVEDTTSNILTTLDEDGTGKTDRSQVITGDMEYSSGGDYFSLYWGDTGTAGVNKGLVTRFFTHTLRAIDEATIGIFEVWLDYKDVYAIEMNTFIYIDGVKFFINRIIDFQPIKLGLTKVELVKVG